MSELPQDLTPHDQDQIEAERKRMFTRAFWISLLKGREGLGDTFWAGNYLAALFFMPVYVVLLALPPLYPLMAPAFVLFGVYLLFVARAVWLAVSKSGTTSRGWKIAGVIWTVLNAISVMAVSPFTGG